MRTLASREKPKPSLGIMPIARSALPFSFSSWSRAMAYLPGCTPLKVSVTEPLAGTTALCAPATPRQRGNFFGSVVMHARTTPLVERISLTVTVTFPSGQARALGDERVETRGAQARWTGALDRPISLRVGNDATASD